MPDTPAAVCVHAPGRCDVADQVFKSPSFVNRLGSQHGLKQLGMYNEGIIWNNDTTGWQTKRKCYFAEGEHMRLPLQHMQQLLH